jgi:hypothetical protein
MRRLAPALVVATMLVMLLASPAAGGAPTEISIAPTSGPPGTTITVSYNGFCDTGSASGRIELLDPNGQVVADTGFFTPTSFTTLGTITVPPGSAPGAYTVRGTCNNQPPGQQSDSEPFEVTGEPAPPAPAEAVAGTPRFTG